MLYHFVKVAVGSCDNPDVQLDLFIAAHTGYFFLLQDAQKLSLGKSRSGYWRVKVNARVS